MTGGIEMETKDDLIVEGYRFATLADAEAARLDVKRIKNLEDNLDYRKPQSVLMLYQKALENRIFQTPVGFAYLLQIKERLIHFGIPEEQIRPVPLHVTFSNKTDTTRSVQKSAALRKLEYKNKFITSVCLNVLMAIVIAAMFVIALKSDAPNILNYRRAVVDEYSEWEQELTDREREVREAERQLNSSGNSN